MFLDERRERLGDLQRREISFGGLLAHHPLDDFDQPDVYLGNQLSQGSRLQRLVREELLRQARTGEWHLSRDHVIKSTSERIDIASDIGGVGVPRLFGSHIIKGADRGTLASDTIFL